MRALLLTVASALATMALVFGSTLPAVAATLPPPPSNSFTPSGSKPRAFMINILGSMLGAATPDRWKREQLANAHRYNHSWEQLSAQHGVAPNGGYLNNPSSYDDYVLKNIEKAEGVYYDENGVRRGGFTAPATATKQPTKPRPNTGGGALGAITGGIVGFTAGVGAGKFVSELMGFDPESGLCNPTFEDFGLIAGLTGTDCSALDFASDFTPNEDANGEPFFAPSCVVYLGTNYCLDAVGSLQLATYPGYYYGCLKGAPAFWTATTSQISPRPMWKINGSWTTMPIAGNGIGTANPTVLPLCSTAFGAGTTNMVLDLKNPIQPARPTDLNDVAAFGLCIDTHTKCVVANGPTSTRFSPQTVVPGDPDPDRTLTCEVVGSDGNTYTQQTATYKESEGGLPTPECPSLPPGVAPQSFAMTENGPDGPVEIFREDTTEAYQDWLTAHPNCVTGACKLDLLTVESSAPVSCFDMDEMCHGWFDDPAKADLYQCVYGGTPVALEECNVYQGVFDPDRLAVGAPYSDPLTGLWSGGQSSPTAGTQLMNSGVQNPDAQRECWGEGWAQLNPVEWVLQPIKCATEWAFVPRPTVVQLAGVQASTAFEERAPGQLAAMVGGWQIAPSMSGCSRSVAFDANPFDASGGSVELWNVCPGSDLEQLGVIARVVTGLGLLVMVVTMLRRSTMTMVS